MRIREDKGRITRNVRKRQTDRFIRLHFQCSFVDIHRSISSENKGFRMLSKLGWSEGQSLGKRNDGLKEPVNLQLEIPGRHKLKRFPFASDCASIEPRNERLGLRHRRQGQDGDSSVDGQIGCAEKAQNKYLEKNTRSLSVVWRCSEYVPGGQRQQ